MSTAIKTLLYSILRKIVFSSGAVWIAKLIDSGVMTEADVDRIIQIAIAIVLMFGSAAWTYVSKWLEAKKADKSIVK